jgi:threonine/homoserine/homoserine lactone efflux protein
LDRLGADGEERAQDRPRHRRRLVVDPSASIPGAVAAFAAFAALLTITPGVDTALVIRTSLVGGPRAGRVTALGICTGVVLWGGASALGLSALVTASERAYDVVRIAGACYLVWLGAKALWGRKVGGDEPPAGARSSHGAFRAGVLSNLLNPKIAAFYVSVLPQFVPDGAPVLATSMLLACVHALQGVVWLFLVASLVGWLGVRLQRPRVKRRLEQLTGLVLLGLGVRLAFERR